jgi:pyruvate dehydrogenase E1 component
VGTVYDPFVCRGLDALIYGLYNGARFVVVGTPAGITLAPEGGAHQSTITPSIGLELPGLSYCEPAYAPALDWLLCNGLQRLAAPEGDSLYLRLSTRPIDQAPFAAALERIGTESIREAVLAGGYRLVEHESPDLVLAACGAVMPEVVEAARLLADEGVGVRVIDLTSPDRLHRAWRASVRDAARCGRRAGPPGHLASLLVPGVPIVTIHDAASHALSWLGSVFGSRTIPVGVDSFGQSGSIHELYGVFDLLPHQIVNAALVALN